MKRTWKQTETAKRRAENFVRNVQGDADRADEIASESVEDYAERKRIQIENPSQQLTIRRVKIMVTTATKAELEQELEDAYARIEELESHIAAGVELLPDDEDDEDDDTEEEAA
jgi:hypothetical protein